MTYLDRKNPDGTYAFISYSHKDKDAVKRILTALDEYGADFWYDIKLRVGQDWINKVKEVTANRNCLGILYFLSPNSVISDACFEEFKMFEELQKTHKDFKAVYILIDDEKPDDFVSFIKNTRKKLTIEYEDDFDKIAAHTSYIKEKFDERKIYLTSAKDAIDGDAFVKKVFKDVFSAWGCTSEETGKINILREDELVDEDYRIKTPCRMSVGVRSSNVKWQVFSFNGNTLSAILVSDELYDATCRSLAVNAMELLNENVNFSLVNSADEGKKNEKHLNFEGEFAECLVRGEKGYAFRFLRSVEHEQNYPQLKRALEAVPVTDITDDGYFFVCDNQGKLLFADRGSDDVYRYIHVDAYASVIPVIDVDYNRYRAYVLRNKSV